MESREKLIISEIKKNPGIRFREVMEKIDLSNGVLSYYVKKLENNGIIKTKRTTRVSRFFIKDMTEEELSKKRKAEEEKVAKSEKRRKLIQLNKLKREEAKKKYVRPKSYEEIRKKL